MARKQTSTFSCRILYWRLRHLLLRFFCLHEAAILALLVAILLTQFRSIFLGFLSICTSATAVAELCSPHGEVPWNIFAASRRALAIKCVKCMGFLHVREAVYGVSKCEKKKFAFVKTSALGLRFLKGSHPCFPGSLCSLPRPGVWMWSSRQWRASRRASPYLSPEFAG